MIALGVMVAIIDDDRVLLTKREDFEVWCLPGGSVEEGETLAAAGIREAKEETGLDVELTRLVGVYSRLGGGMADVHAVLYAAKPVGGELQIQSGETVEVAFFSFDDLPQEMLFGTQKRVSDAIGGACCVSVRQEINTPDKTQYSRQKLYEMRDRSGLTRQQFYFQRFEEAEIKEIVEVGDS